jgi:Flp pilus assembly protein TadD
MTSNDHFQYLAWRRKRRVLAVAIGLPVVALLYIFANQYTRKAWMKTANLSDLGSIASASPGDTDVQFNYAFRLMGDGQTPEALAIMKRVVKEAPNNPMYLFGLGRCATAMGEALLGEECMLKVIAMKPDMPEAHFTLASIYGSANLVTDAIKEFDEAVRLGGRLKSDRAIYGECLVKAGRYEDAWRVLKEFVTEDRMNSEVYPLLMVAAKHTGNDEEANTLALNRLKMTSSYPLHEIRALLIERALGEKWSKETIQRALFLAEDVAKVGNSVTINILLGRIRLLNGDPKGALAALDHTLEHERNSSNELDVRARALRQLGRVDEAQRCEKQLATLRAPADRLIALRRAIVEAPDDTNHQLALAKELKSQSKYGEATEACIPIVAKHPDNAEAKQLHDECRKLALQHLEQASKKIVEQEDRFAW